MNDTPAERAAESTWARLRRRKVVQWGLIYVATAWGFLQGLEYLSESFNWPQQVRQIAVLVLVIGLPIVLVLAWYHGDRGQQRVSTPELAILTLLLLLGGGAFWYYQRAGEAKEDPAATAGAVQPETSPGIKDARPSVAVLPFENRSDESKDVFFVDGIHDDILTQLSKVSALRVISRTSVEQFRKTELSVQQIAQQLGVRSILEGGVQRSADRVRINVQLINAATDSHVWAESYDRELSAANIFGIQSEVATAIADALKAALTPVEQARVNTVPTQNLEAWEAYQIGRQRMVQRTSAALADAERSFRRSIALDPDFALGYVGLGDALQLQIDYSGAPMDLTLRNAEAAVEKAVELDPNLAEAWTTSGGIASKRFQFDRAEVMYRRAIELNPNYALARHWYGVMLGEDLFRTDEALTQLQRAVELDPFSAVIRALGVALEQKGRFQDAADSYREAISIDPTRPNPYLLVADLKAMVFNDFPGAIPLDQKAIGLDPDSPKSVGYLAAHYSDLGEHNRVMELLSKAVERWSDDYSLRSVTALAQLYMGDYPEAMRHAQHGLDLHPRYSFTLALVRDEDLRAGRLAKALSRYQKSYPELFETGSPRIDRSNFVAAIDLALVMQKLGETERADQMLDGAEQVIRHIPRLGFYGYSISDVRIHALRHEKAQALTASGRQNGSAGESSGVTTAISTPPSPPSATSPSSRPSSPTSSATWRSSVPPWQRVRRMRRLN